MLDVVFYRNGLNILPQPAVYMSMETRKYRVIPTGSRGVTVAIRGTFPSDQAWREAAAVKAGFPGVDATFAAERVIRLFPWWAQ